MPENSAARLSCPRCPAPLQQHAFGPVVVDGCDQCGGLWFDPHELAQLAAGGREAVLAAEAVFPPPGLAATPADQAGMCPKCQVALYEFQFPHTPEVTLDACPQCRGIWVDDRELEAIARRLAPTTAPAPPAAPGPRPPLRQRARQVASFIQRVPCPKCGELNYREARSCWACAETLVPRGSKLCPRCDNSLRYLTAEDLMLDPVPHLEHCAGCGGLWVEHGPLAQLLGLEIRLLQRWQDLLAAEVAGGAGDRKTQIICPSCQLVLSDRPYAEDDSVHVDHCVACRGTWLDNGELTLIKRVSIAKDVWGGSS